MSTENPYAASVVESKLVSGGDRERLRKIATAQRHVNFAVLFYLCLFPFNIAVSAIAGDTIWAALLTLVAVLAVLVYGMVSVFCLASLFHGTVSAVFHVLGLFVPLLGLVILIMISSRATTILRANGVKVGLLGANPKTI